MSGEAGLMTSRSKVSRESERQHMKEILDIIHKTIYQFFDVCEDDVEAPMSDKDKLLLKVNKAICNNLKTLEQNSCEDCISRKAVLDLKTIAPIAPVINGEDVHYEEVVFVRDLEKLSSIEPERKTGKWIDYPFENVCGLKLRDYRCNLCAYFVNGKTKFCPNCGAKMEV